MGVTRRFLVLSILSIIFGSVGCIKEEPELVGVSKLIHESNESPFQEGSIMYVKSPEWAQGFIQMKDRPDLIAETVKYLENGEEVEIIAVDQKNIAIADIYGHLVMVQSGEEQGWIFSGYLSESKEIVINENFLLEEKIMYVKSPEGLRMRDKPDLTGERISLLEDGQEVNVFEYDPNRVVIDGIDGYWVYVKSEEEEGWVFNGYLRDSKDSDIELRKVNELVYRYEPWNSAHRDWGIRNISYEQLFVDNQVLCRDHTYYMDGNNLIFLREYYLKNYLTGEVTYRFEEPITLWRAGSGISSYPIRDQHGIYLFLDKEEELVLFDVQEKWEFKRGEPLKRSPYIYYTEKRTVPASVAIQNDGRMVQRSMTANYIIKYDLITREITEIADSITVDAITRINSPVETRKVMERNNLYLFMAMSNYYRTLEEIGNNQLLSRNYFVLQLNETMTEMLSITAVEAAYLDRNIVSLSNGNYITFKDIPEMSDDVGTTIYVQLMDEKGNIKKEYRNITMGINHGRNVEEYCLISPDKQYVLFINNNLLHEVYGFSSQKVDIYQILY